VKRKLHKTEKLQVNILKMNENIRRLIERIDEIITDQGLYQQRCAERNEESFLDNLLKNSGCFEIVINNYLWWFNRADEKG